MNRIATSLAGKLILSIGLLLMLSVGILFYKLIISEKNDLINNAVRQTASYSDLINKSIHYDMLTFHKEAIQNTVTSIGSNSDIKNITIFDKKGKIIYSSDPGQIGHSADKSSIACLGCHADPLKPSETLKAGKQWKIYYETDGHGRLTHVEPIYNEQSCYTASCHFHPEAQKILGILTSDFSLLSVDNDVRKQSLNLAITALVFICVISLVLFLFLRNFVHKPVSLLAKAMQQITVGNTSQRINITSRDEIGMLATTFNAMSENLQKTTVSRDLLVREVKERKEVQEQLAKSERFLNTIFESIQSPFIIFDRDYGIVRANKEYARLRKIPIMDLLDEQCYKVLYGKDCVCDNCIVEKTFRSSDPCAAEKMIKSEDGTEAWFDIYSYPIADEDGNVSHVIEYFLDVTEKKRAYKALRKSEERYRTFVTRNLDGIFKVNADGTFALMNPAGARIFGYETPEEIIGRNALDYWRDPKDRDVYREELKIKKSVSAYPMRAKNKNGEPIELESSSRIIEDENGNFLGIEGILRDVTGRKHLEEELRSLSLRDELTGLYNRRGFITLAERELKMADRLKRGIFMLYADLDGLKAINDTLGHKEGDGAIRETAEVLSDTFRNSDIIGRIGGDEFVIVPIGIAGDNIDLIKARLQKNVDIQNRKLDRKYELSISVGVAYYDPAHLETIDELLMRADALMYEQKNNKRRS